MASCSTHSLSHGPTHGAIPWVLACLALAFTPGIWAQGACSSDGVRPPTALLERFFSADCEACWTQPAPPDVPASAKNPILALDWIVPSAQGDEAPLSAAATGDALTRLDALDIGRPPADRAALHLSHAITAKRGPQAGDAWRTRDRPMQRIELRVARGPVLGGYMGTSIELRHPALTAPQAPWTVWLALVETVAAGSEGSPVARNLVRNLFTTSTSTSTSISTGHGPSTPKPARWFESRVMSIPAGARPERLQVIGWVQNSRGDMVAIAKSVCAPEAETR